MAAPKKAARKSCSREMLDALSASLQEVATTWRAYRRQPDMETLHNLRTAVRQTRVLISFGIYPEPAQRCGEFLKQVARTLSPARDLDVGLALLQTLDKPGGKKCTEAYRRLRSRLTARRRARYTAIHGLTETPVGRTLQRHIHSAIQELRELEQNARPEATLHTGQVLVEKTVRRIRRKRNLAHSSDEHRLHELRILIRRLRYLHSLMPNLFTRETEALYEKLRACERRLGKLHDVDMVLQFLDEAEDTALQPLIAEARQVRRKRRKRFRDAWEKLPKGFQKT